MIQLSYVGRRVLAHLPVWAEDEAAHIEAEGGVENSIRAYSLAALTVRLGEDQSCPRLDEAALEQQLRELAGVNFCVEAEDGWRMTQAGFEFLTDPTEKGDPNREPEPAIVNLNPSVHESTAEAA